MAETFQNFIDGQWTGSTDKRPNINPSDIDDCIGEFPCADRAEAEAAIRAASGAFPAWRDSGIQQRSDILDRAGDMILARREELGKLLSREEGKTLPEGIGEVARAGQIFKFFAGEVLRPAGELLASVRPGVEVAISREPVGTIGIITPWNFPIAIPAWKIAPALAFGNTVVFKPAELVPGSATELVRILQEAGLPAGVLNLVCGPGSKVGAAMVDSNEIDAISFTGSQDTGAGIALACAERLRRCQLEMGGKNPLIVLDDADLDVAVECAIQGSYYSTGQRCTASSRLIVQDGIHDKFVEAMISRLSSLKVGHALDPATQIGPVIDQRQLDQDLDYIRIGREEGATLAFGGETLQLDQNGYYLEPALFTETQNHMRINREEIFGPVATVIRVAEFEEALDTANDTPFGLSAGICTGSLSNATEFRRRARAGMVMVNLPTAGVDYHVPFGGTKGSSYGPREQGTYAREFYTTVKTGYVAA
jgi:aldehyde dehydrogenase (NAD+)